MNPYTVLGIGTDATPEEIRRAYRRKARLYHPDRGGEAWIFQQIQEAYSLVCAPLEESASVATAVAPARTRFEQKISPETAHKLGAMELDRHALLAAKRRFEFQGKLVAFSSLGIAIFVCSLAMLWEPGSYPPSPSTSVKSSRSVAAEEAVERKTNLTKKEVSRNYGNVVSDESVMNSKGQSSGTASSKIPHSDSTITEQKFGVAKARHVSANQTSHPITDRLKISDHPQWPSACGFPGLFETPRPLWSTVLSTVSVTHPAIGNWAVEKKSNRRKEYSILASPQFKVGNYKAKTISLVDPDSVSEGQFRFTHDGKFVWNERIEGSWRLLDGKLKLNFPITRLKVEPATITSDGFKGQARDANGNPFVFVARWIND